LLQQGKKDETEVFLKQTKKDLPDNAATYSPTDIHFKKNYIGLLIWKNRLDEAAKLNNEIFESRSNDVEGLIHKGEILLGKNDVAGAIEALQAALHNNLGRLLRSLRGSRSEQSRCPD
jgi:predicted Zn-dependent protease